MGAYDDDFKQRGIKNVKLQVKHASFAEKKIETARKWMEWEERKWLRRGFYLGIVMAIIAVVGLYLKN